MTDCTEPPLAVVADGRARGGHEDIFKETQA